MSFLPVAHECALTASMASCLEEYTQPTHNELSLDVGASCGSRPPGTLSPTLRVRGYYVQDLPVNILSKNAINVRLHTGLRVPVRHSSSTNTRAHHDAVLDGQEPMGEGREAT